MQILCYDVCDEAGLENEKETVLDRQPTFRYNLKSQAWYGNLHLSPSSFSSSLHIRLFSLKSIVHYFTTKASIKIAHKCFKYIAWYAIRRSW